MQVEVLRYPTDDDWLRCLNLARSTAGKPPADTPPSHEWRTKILLSGHSPARTLMFTIALRDLPYYVSVHLVRHHIGVEHYVSSQRNDRQSNYDRRIAPQNAPVTHIMDINAPALINMAGWRLCQKADPETHRTMLAIRKAVIEVCPEIRPCMLPNCGQRFVNCHEMLPCDGCKEVLT